MPTFKHVSGEYLADVKVGDKLWISYGYNSDYFYPRTVDVVTKAQIGTTFTNVAGLPRKTRFWKKPTTRYSTLGGMQVGGSERIRGIATDEEITAYEVRQAAEEAEGLDKDAIAAARAARDQEVTSLFTGNVRAWIQDDGAWRVSLNDLTLAQVQRIAAALSIPEGGGMSEFYEVQG